MVAISAEKTNAIQAIFSRSKAVIGVIHCDPFPGAPKYRGKSVSDIIERALRDAENYISGGVHGLIIENHGDIPFSRNFRANGGDYRESARAFCCAAGH